MGMVVVISLPLIIFCLLVFGCYYLGRYKGRQDFKHKFHVVASHILDCNVLFGIGQLVSGDLVQVMGHSLDLGGSTGFCDIKNRFAIAVTLNKMSFGTATRRIIQFVCSELNVPLPDEFSVLSETVPDEESSILRPMIN
ncbi:hypothetical protein DKX38_027652 [Salix brachista]|uniref:Uncharacterized protein n=1 Tax=Salix brachista TaxID=2182728 RepID=A0A5N5J5P6_9ROSI|nr:hypothetical protein DKX38_027652 [Salix brachista]